MPDPEAAPATAAERTAAPAILPVAEEQALADAIEHPAVAGATASKFDATVDLWFAECIQGTPVGRYTDAYNAIYAAKDELKRRLNQET